MKDILKEFDEKIYVWLNYDGKGACCGVNIAGVRAFLKKALQKKDQAMIEKIEGMKKQIDNSQKDFQGVYWTEITTHNKALNDILNLINQDE